MKIAQHGITLPSSNELDRVFVNVRIEKSHGATSADIFRGKTVFANEFGGDFEQKPCNVFSLYLLDTIVRKMSCQNGGRGYRVGAQVKDAADNGADRAKQVMAAKATIHHFTLDTILLSGECEGNTLRTPEILSRRCG